jgi:acyl-CoA dehydrogenase
VTAPDDMSTELRALVADITDDAAPPAPGALPECWGQLADAGLPLIGVPEDRDGSGGTVADLATVCYELGRHGLSSPLLHSATAAWVLSREASVKPLLRSIAPATQDDEGCVTAHVPWGRHAEELVLIAGARAFLVPAHDAEVTELARNLAGEPVDTVRVSIARASTVLVSTTSVRTARVAPDESASVPADRLRARLDLLWAAAITGAGHGAVTLTRDYLAERRQFDAPLLAIPAVAAGVARMRAALIQSDAALARATDAALAAQETAGAGWSAAVARVIAAQAATDIARISHQLHGAIGVTAEYPLARYTTRLWAWRDAEVSEQEHAVNLGRLAAAGGESALWLSLTS